MVGVEISALVGSGKLVAGVEVAAECLAAGVGGPAADSGAGDAGVPEDRIMMQKPVETTGGGEDREARRVEVSVAQ